MPQRADPAPKAFELYKQTGISASVAAQQISLGSQRAVAHKAPGARKGLQKGCTTVPLSREKVGAAETPPNRNKASDSDRLHTGGMYLLRTSAKTSKSPFTTLRTQPTGNYRRQANWSNVLGGHRRERAFTLGEGASIGA